MKYLLFEVLGIELEYMIVREDDLRVAPIADEIFFEVNHSFDGEKKNGLISWSNELAAHVIELKTTSPAKSTAGLSAAFHRNIREINRLLRNRQCFLLPTGCHPFMNPLRETKIWPHDNHDIYELYHQIFDCRGHGWSNVQSMHLNLPFCGEQEFARLHAAVRLLLPVLPALCAGSPFIEGRKGEYKDMRMHFYATNQRKIPLITGKIIPEQIFDSARYHSGIYEPIRAALKPYDPENVLEDCFVNSRGAIARFDRGAIEIRVMDVQECPGADIAIAEFVAVILKAMTDEEFSPVEKQMEWNADSLVIILQDSVKNGENAFLEDQDYLREFGIDVKNGIRAGEFWNRIFLRFRSRLSPGAAEVVHHILREGTLSTRILKAVGAGSSGSDIVRVYRQLGKCLAENKIFSPETGGPGG